MEEHKESYKPLHKHKEQDRVELPKTFKILCCPNCDSELPTENLNLDKNLGKCNSCNAVFSIENELIDLQKGPQKIKQEILRPEGVELFHYQNNFAAYFDQPIAPIEWPFVFIYVIAFIAGIGASLELQTIIPFLILSVGSSLLHYLYYLTRKERHRVILEIDEGYLNILWRPRKFIVDKSYKIEDIHQFYVKARSDKAVWYLYMIVDEGQGQKHIKLTSTYSASKTKYLEQEIESYLNIQDAEVPEED